MIASNAASVPSAVMIEDARVDRHVRRQLQFRRRAPVLRRGGAPGAGVSGRIGVRARAAGAASRAPARPAWWSRRHQIGRTRPRGRAPPGASQEHFAKRTSSSRERQQSSRRAMETFLKPTARVRARRAAFRRGCGAAPKHRDDSRAAAARPSATARTTAGQRFGVVACRSRAGPPNCSGPRGEWRRGAWSARRSSAICSGATRLRRHDRLPPARARRRAGRSGAGGLHRGLPGLHQLRSPDAAKAWLARITVRRATRRLRRRRLRSFFSLESLPSDARLVDDSATPEETAEVASTYRLVERIPVRQRVVWVLKHVEGETLDAIAEICGISKATVQRRLRAAERALEVQKRGGPDGRLT